MRTEAGLEHAGHRADDGMVVGRHLVVAGPRLDDAHVREYAVGAGVNASHRVIIREARQDDIGIGCKFRDTVCDDGTVSNQCFRFAAIPVVGG